MFYDFLRRMKYSHIEEIDEQDSVKHWLIQHRLLEEIHKVEAEAERHHMLSDGGGLTEEDVFQRVRKNLEEDEVLDLNLSALDSQNLFEDMSDLVERNVERQLDEFTNDEVFENPNFVMERSLRGSYEYEKL